MVLDLILSLRHLQLLKQVCAKTVSLLATTYSVARSMEKYFLVVNSYNTARPHDYI